MLTKETKLLIDHWPAIEDILAGERQLQTQLVAFLHSLRDDIAKTGWWTDQWHFEAYDTEQIYIAHHKWRTKDDFALWIGVERFDPSVLFGRETLPQLYFWSSVKKPALVTALRQRFQSQELALLGEVDKGPGTYIVRHFLPKCLPGQAEGFEKTMRLRIVQFFSFYAKQEKAISAELKRHLKP